MPTPPARTVHQFHSGSAYGDAVTGSLLFGQELLRSLGFRSEIFVDHVAPELEDRLRPAAAYRARAEDAFLIHHSHGHDRGDWVLHLPGKKVLVYHNITPARFLPRGSCLERYAEIGREQLRQFRPAMAAALAVSDYNAAELRAAGYEDPVTLPLLLDADGLARAPWDPEVARGAGDAFVVLFVGRIVANKCQHDVIEAFAALSHRLPGRSELVLVGGYEAEDPYFRRLARLVEDLRLCGRVRFTGKISQAALFGWYRRAGAFLCLSEHEGFGVPLVEAMAFGVPVLAYDAAAVRETLGGAGVLLESKDEEEIARKIQALASDRAWRRAVVTGQRERLRSLSRARIEARLESFLAEQGIHAGGPAPAHLERVRAPPEVEHASPEAISTLGSELARIDEALCGAERHCEAGAALPPMTRFRGAARLLAVPVAKIILRAAALFTREQRDFNHSALDAVRELRLAMEQLARVQTDIRDLRRELGRVHARLDQIACGSPALSPASGSALPARSTRPGSHPA